MHGHTAIKRGCNVVSGHELVVAMKALQAKDSAGVAETLSGTWTFGNNQAVSTTTVPSAAGDHFSATVTFGAAGADCGYLLPVTAGALTGLTHISLSYRTTAPSAGSFQVRLYGLDGKLVRSCRADAQKAGLTNVNLAGKLGPNMYIVKISGNGSQCVSRSIVTAGL